MDTKTKVLTLLKNKYHPFPNCDVSESYVPSSAIAYGPNTKLVIPENIKHLLLSMGELTRQYGKELSYILLGHDNRKNGNENEVIISEIIFESKAVGNARSVELSSKMLYHTKEKAIKYYNMHGPSSVCLSGHTHPNGYYSDFFSFGDFEHLINIETTWKPKVNCQYGIFVVAGSKNNASLPTTSDFKYAYYHNNFYQFKDVEISKEFTGTISDISKEQNK